MQCALAFFTTSRSSSRPITSSSQLEKFDIFSNRIQTTTTLLFLDQNDDNNSNDDEQKNLLEKAKSLREEAKLLEQELQKDKSSRKISSSIEQQQQEQQQKQKIIITDLDDSLWVFKYRFSSQPKDDDNDNNDNNDVILPNYSGEMMIRLRGDGYSDNISSSSSSPENNKLEIVKVWGWDNEYSNEDDQNYLLFSADIKFPKSDPKLPGQVERCYFQARIETKPSSSSSKEEEITLHEGTVTVKKDVAEKTKGKWGLFKVAGILTEFRYVGDFIAKPAQNQ